MIISALLGVAILTEASQVSGHVLTGIIAYTDPMQGFAIIGNSVRNTYLVRPGQRLPDGSRIREIHTHHVVLEHGGSLETVGMYERGQPTDSGYTQTPPPPQQLRWDGDTRPNETPAREVRSKDTPPSDTPAYEALPRQAQPEGPFPAAQDPADEFGDDRRQRAESRKK
jgi:hypothetical protein